jgi:hypothetical protein
MRINEVMYITLPEIKRKIIWVLVADLKKISWKDRISVIACLMLITTSNVLLANLEKIMPFPYSFIFLMGHAIVIIMIFMYVHENKERLRKKYYL